MESTTLEETTKVDAIPVSQDLYRPIRVEIARRLGCRWHGQVTNRAQLADIAANCQMLVSPALGSQGWEEPFGMSIVKSMASGLPFIASDHVGPRSIITSGTNGILIPEHAVDEITGWVRRLQLNREEWSLISDHAVATARKYSLNNITDGWHRLLVTQPNCGSRLPSPSPKSGAMRITSSLLLIIRLKNGCSMVQAIIKLSKPY